MESLMEACNIHFGGSDFAVKYEGKEHAEHLMSITKECYKITEEFT